ncbi:MAG: hypothetical protein ACN6OB_19620 [Chryseobacterium jejuense]
MNLKLGAGSYKDLEMVVFLSFFKGGFMVIISRCMTNINFLLFPASTF